MGRILRVFLLSCLLACFGTGPAFASSIHNRSVNVDAFGGLLSAVTAVGAESKSLLIDRIHTIHTGVSCTISPNTELVFAPGSGVSIASGATVEFRGKINSGSWQIFFGSGDSLFGSEAMEPFFLEAWIGGTTGFGRSRRAESGYAIDVSGTVRGDTLMGSLATSYLSGTVSNPVMTTETVYGGASKYYVYSGATLTADQLAGGMIYSHAAAPIVLGIPAITGSTPFFLVTDMTGSGVTIQTTDGETIYDGDDSGTAYWIGAGSSRHSVSITLNAESGTCAYGIVLGTTGSNWTIE